MITVYPARKYLFNNLNTLTAIVEENLRQAVDLTEKVSLVCASTYYRNVIKSS